MGPERDVVSVSYCPSCAVDTETDVMDGHFHPGDRAYVPPRLFCGVCGWWLGYGEYDADSVAPEPPPSGVQVCTVWIRDYAPDPILARLPPGIRPVPWLPVGEM
jgi:hypothetical protein